MLGPSGLTPVLLCAACLEGLRHGSAFLLVQRPKMQSIGRHVMKQLGRGGDGSNPMNGDAPLDGRCWLRVENCVQSRHFQNGTGPRMLLESLERPAGVEAVWWRRCVARPSAPFQPLFKLADRRSNLRTPPSPFLDRPRGSGRVRGGAAVTHLLRGRGARRRRRPRFLRNALIQEARG